MTAATFFACALSAYSPAIAIFSLHTSRYPQLVIISLFSAFFWLLAALLSSGIWLGIRQAIDSLPLTIFYSVLVQEIFRWLYIRSLLRAEQGLHKASHEPDSPYNRVRYALASGLGFGLISGMVSYVSLLSSAWGPGQLFLPSCPQVSLYYIAGTIILMHCFCLLLIQIIIESAITTFLSAIITCISILLQMVWMVLSVECYAPSIVPAIDSVSDHPPSILSDSSRLSKFLWVIGGHWFCSYATLFNSSSLPGGCAGGILLPAIYLIVSAWLCYRQLLGIKKSADVVAAAAAAASAFSQSSQTLLTNK